MNPDELKIVIARLEAMPSHLKVSIGRFGSFDKWELIDAVKKGNEIGELIGGIYMENLRGFKKEVEKGD